MRRQFVTRQGGSDDAYLEGMLGTANAVLGQIDRKDGDGQLSDRSIEDLIAIKGIRVVEGTNGHFVTMPQSKDKEGNYHDIAFPVTADLRKAVNKAVLDEFTKVNEKSTPKHEKTSETKNLSKPTSELDFD